MGWLEGEGLVGVVGVVGRGGWGGWGGWGGSGGWACWAGLVKKLNVTPKKKNNLCTTRPALLVKMSWGIFGNLETPSVHCMAYQGYFHLDLIDFTFWC